MAYVEPPETRIITPFWRLGFKFEALASYFFNLASDISDVWLIGQWLAIPFALIAGTLSLCQAISWEADQTVGEALTWIQSLVSGTLVLELLQALWAEFSELRLNPINWLLGKLITLWSEFNQLRSNPIDWLRHKITILIPQIWSVFENTRQWFVDLVSNNWPEMYQMFISPFGTLRDWINRLYPLFQGFINNPIAYILHVVFSTYPYLLNLVTHPGQVILTSLINGYPRLFTMLMNPITWFKEQFGLMLGLPGVTTYSIMVDIGLSFLNHIKINRLGVRGKVKQLVCDIIVSFL